MNKSRENTEQLRARLLADPQVQDMIRHRAFDLYQHRAGRPGSAADDWFQAENEVLKFWIEKERGASNIQVAEEPIASVEEPVAHVAVEETPAASAQEIKMEAKSKTRKAVAKPATPPKAKKTEAAEGAKETAPKKASAKKTSSKKSGETKSKPRKSKTSQPEADA